MFDQDDVNRRHDGAEWEDDVPSCWVEKGEDGWRLMMDDGVYLSGPHASKKAAYQWAVDMNFSCAPIDDDEFDPTPADLNTRLRELEARVKALENGYEALCVMVEP